MPAALEDPSRRRYAAPQDEGTAEPASLGSRMSVAFVEPADMLLGVELDADLLDEVDLGFEEVDMAFLVGHQLLEQVLGHPVADAVAIGGRFAVEVAGLVFRREVRFEDFLDVLADAQGIEHLEVGEAFQKDDALDEAVRVVHLLDGFLAPGLGEALVAPIIQEPVMQPVLVDRRQLAAQAAIEILDNLRIALHPNSLVHPAPGAPNSL